MMEARKALCQYLTEVKDKPFVWGEHDCLTFTNEAWARMYGEGWADDWLGRYMPNGKTLGKQAMRKEFGHKTLEDAIDARLRRVDCVPPLGALVTTDHSRKWVTGAALGIFTGSRGAFIGKDGLVYLPIEHIKDAWVK